MTIAPAIPERCAPDMSLFSRNEGKLEETRSLPAAGEDSALRGPQRAIAVAAVLAALVLVVLDAAAANIALPTIARSLRISAAMSVWVMTSYQAALVMALLPLAALGESAGYRRIFVGGIVLFLSASLLCSVSPSLPCLLAARFLQGLGGAAIMALGVALLRLAVPSERLGAAIGWNALAIALSSAAGPTIGAAILSISSWRWLFAVSLPLGAFILVAAQSLPVANGTHRRLDLISVALNAAAFASFVIGAAFLASLTMLAVLMLVAAALFVALLLRRESAKPAPLIPLDLLRDPSFRNSIVASVLCFSGVAAGMVALPFYLQHGLGCPAWMTGLYMTPWPLAVAIAAPVAGRLSNYWPTSQLCAAGGLLLAVGLGGAAVWPLQEHPLALIPLTMISGFGFGLFNVPNNRNMFLSVPLERSGAAGGMQGTARLTGQTAGAIAMALLFTIASVDDAPRLGLATAAALTLAGGMVSLLRCRL